MGCSTNGSQLLKNIQSETKLINDFRTMLEQQSFSDAVLKVDGGDDADSEFKVSEGHKSSMFCCL